MRPFARTLRTLIALVSIVVGTAALAAPAPVVITRAGAVKGVAGYPEVFRGIPYAAPPVGALRWRAPEAARPWKGVRDATHFGNDCMQLPWIVESGVPFSEDCLTVNVWTPSHGGVRRPVIVYLYGGAFIGGSGAYALYDGSPLAREGVVVVNFNYRVGVLGFLAHPGLSKEAPTHSSGNYGLMDQIAALRWVHDNIAAFGGDPDRVAIYGESAGAAAEAMLLVSPKSKGLFRVAILQSPTLPRLSSLAESEAAGLRLGADIAALRRMPAEELLKHNFDFFAATASELVEPRFPAPTLDADVLPEQPRDAFARGAIHPAVVVVGHNADEGAMFMPRPAPDRAGYEAWLARHFGSLAPRLAALHPAADDAAVQSAMSAVLGDAMFVESARFVARASARAGRPTYGYVFTKSVANQPPAPWHSESVRYVFGTLDSPGFVPGRPAANAGDHILSRTMRRYWARFAVQGDPNGAGLPAWPRYDATSDSVIEFAEPVHASAGFHRETLDALEGFWDRAR